MHAQIGDEVVVEGRFVETVPREGEVLEVLETGGVEHYRVRWDDGHESLLFPGNDAHIVHLKRAAKR